MNRAPALCIVLLAFPAGCGDSGSEDGSGAAGPGSSGSTTVTSATGSTGSGSTGSGGTGAKRMFLGPEQAGDFGGVQSGDAICQAEASAAGLAGTYRALLGSSPAEALALFHGPGPFVAIDADGATSVIFADQAGLSSGPLASLEVDAAGNDVGAGDAWSGVSARCNAWTTAANDAEGTIMSVTPSGGDGWLDIGTYPCSSLKYLVCLEQ